jgi:hypothetical protein
MSIKFDIAGNTRSMLLVAITATVLLPAIFSLPSIAIGVQRQAAGRAEGILVCAVSGEGDAEMTLDPIVIVRNGRLEAPYAEYNDTAQSRFAGSYFKSGRKYRLLFGGGEAGTATISKWDKGCNNIHANAAVESSVRIRGQVRALAVSGGSVGRKTSARRAPTDDERAAVMELVKKIYTSKATSAGLLRTLQTTNLTATDLDSDGKFEMIGSFVIATKDNRRRDLFLIAKLDGSSYKAELANFQEYKLPPEGFDSEIKFVDQLDVNGDGLGEVLATQTGFDAYAYIIYQKRNGRWLKVYTAMGDAC